MCGCASIVPVLLILKSVVELPSPQSTDTCHGLSLPGSVNEPRLKEWLEPSFELWSVAAATSGGTFATCTTWTDSEALSDPPSESVTLIFTSVLAGPSGKKQSKLPPVASVWSEFATYWPPVPQSG